MITINSSQLLELVKYTVGTLWKKVRKQNQMNLIDRSPGNPHSAFGLILGLWGWASLSSLRSWAPVSKALLTLYISRLRVHHTLNAVLGVEGFSAALHPVTMDPEKTRLSQNPTLPSYGFNTHPSISTG